MDENRNIDFDTTVEVDSLKDAIWRLTTRVYLLEDFIAERFGEVIGSSGFTKLTMTSAPGTSGLNSSSSSIDASINIQNTPSRPENRRKRKKQEHTSSVEATVPVRSNKIQKNMESTRTPFESDHEESVDIHQLDFEQIENDPLLIPKNEECQRVCENVDANDYFLNENSDYDEETNDSEKDPDFNPLLPPLHYSPVTTIERRHAMTDRVGESYTLTKSNRGHQLLVDSEKNTYGLHQRRKGGKKIIWRCNRYYDIRCKGRCYTLDDKMYLINPHCHFENEEDFKVRELKLKIKEMAASTTLTSSEIVATVLEGIDETVKSRLPKMKTLYHLVPSTRMKQKRGSQLSTNVETSQS